MKSPGDYRLTPRARLIGLTSHRNDPGLIVRIDQPTDGSSWFGSTIPLRGWISATTSERIELRESSLRFYVERITDRASLLYNGLSFIGTEVAAEPGETPWFTRAIAFSDSLIPLPEMEVGEGRARVEFEAELDLSAWSGASTLVRVIGKYQHGSAVTLSNQIVVSLGDEQRRSRAYGGFAVPAGDTALRVERVQFEVWAAKAGDPPESAELISAEQRIPMLKATAPEQDKVDALPDCGVEGHARFVAAIATGTLGAAGADFQPIPLQALVRFRSGAELSIAGPTVRLAMVKGASDGEGEIQLLRTLPTGNIELRGVLTMPGIGPVRAFLEARSWRIELHPGESVPWIHWESQSLLETTEPLLCDSFSSFHAVFSPDALGPTPGAVRLVFEREEMRVIAGPPNQLARISGLMARAAPKQKIATMLCKVGHRRSFAAPSVAERGEGRVLIASPNLSAVEGAPKVLCDVVTSLHAQTKRGMLVVAAADGTLRERYEAAGIPVTIMSEFSGDGLDWERYHRGLAAVAALEGERRFTAVLANVIDSYWAVDFARRRQLPSAWIVHESVEPSASFAGVDSRLRLLFLEALRVVKLPLFVAERTATLFRPHLSSDAVVIANGVDGEALAAASAAVDRAAVRSELGIAPEAKVVSIVGTTTRRKGQDIFLREMAELRRRHDGAPLRFVIVGAREVPFLRELRVLASELGLEESVVFVPEQPAAERFFAISDVMVIASREESAPLVSLEAFAHGVPLVSSRVFGLADQIRDGDNALAFELDEFGSLARQVERLLGDDALRSQLVANARADLQSRFSRERAMTQYVDVLRALC